MDNLILKGNIINPVNESKTEILKDRYLIIEKGKIKLITGNKKEALAQISNKKIIDHKNDLILPGFVDVHTHIPQYPAIGQGKGDLLDWLEEYIFPLEQKFSDRIYAEYLSEKFFRSCLSFGTTTVSAYSSVHYDATDAAFESASKTGIRAFIGNSMMDVMNNRELFLNVEDNLNIAEKLTEKWHRSSSILNYIVTPRYAGSCSFELLKAASEYANKNDLLIQTHLAENLNEINYIKKQFPDFDDYTEVYFKSGLLGDNAILAHCIHLSEKEINILRETNSKIAHCPTSNAFLSSGIMPFRKYHNDGLTIGLGSDVSAGYTLDLKNEAKNAIEFSKLYKTMSDKTKNEMRPEEAFYLMTLGGAKTLNIEDITGSIHEGKQADISIFENNFENGSIEDFENIEEIFGKLIYSGGKRAMKTYVKGKLVHRDQ